MAIRQVSRVALKGHKTFIRWLTVSQKQNTKTNGNAEQSVLEIVVHARWLGSFRGGFRINIHGLTIGRNRLVVEHFWHVFGDLARFHSRLDSCKLHVESVGSIRNIGQHVEIFHGETDSLVTLDPPGVHAVGRLFISLQMYDQMRGTPPYEMSQRDLSVFALGTGAEVRNDLLFRQQFQTIVQIQRLLVLRLRFRHALVYSNILKRQLWQHFETVMVELQLNERFRRRSWTWDGWWWVPTQWPEYRQWKAI